MPLAPYRFPGGTTSSGRPAVSGLGIITDVNRFIERRQGRAYPADTNDRISFRSDDSPLSSHFTSTGRLSSDADGDSIHTATTPALSPVHADAKSDTSAASPISPNTPSYTAAQGQEKPVRIAFYSPMYHWDATPSTATEPFPELDRDYGSLGDIELDGAEAGSALVCGQVPIPAADHESCNNVLNSSGTGRETSKGPWTLMSFRSSHPSLIPFASQQNSQLLPSLPTTLCPSGLHERYVLPLAHLPSVSLASGYEPPETIYYPFGKRSALAFEGEPGEWLLEEGIIPDRDCEGEWVGSGRMLERMQGIRHGLQMKKGSSAREQGMQQGATKTNCSNAVANSQLCTIDENGNADAKEEGRHQLAAYPTLLGGPVWWQRGRAAPYSDPMTVRSVRSSYLSGMPASVAATYKHVFGDSLA